jgi:hypothetical protein
VREAHRHKLIKAKIIDSWITAPRIMKARYLNFFTKTALVATCCFLFFSCTYKEKIIVTSALPKLPVSGEKKIKVDSLTSWMAVYPQIITFGGRDFVTSLDVINNSLKLFDFDSATLVKSLDFRKEARGSMADILSIEYVSEDTILYLDQSNKLFMLDRNLVVRKNLQVKDKTMKGTPLFYDNTLPLVRLSAGKFLATNYFTTRSDRRLHLTIDLNSDEIRYVLPPPKEYVKGYYGFDEFGYWNFAYNSKAKILVHNYPQLDSLYLYDLGFKLLKKVPARSTLATDPVSPVIGEDLDELAQGSYELPVEKIKMRVKQSFVYGDLLYNEEKGQYYRFVGLPISSEDLALKDPLKSQVRRYTLMVFDENFNFINEYEIPYDKYLIKGPYFIYKGKLFIQKKMADDEYMHFDIIDI